MAPSCGVTRRLLLKTCSAAFGPLLKLMSGQTPDKGPFFAPSSGTSPTPTLGSAGPKKLQLLMAEGEQGALMAEGEQGSTWILGEG